MDGDDGGDDDDDEPLHPLTSAYTLPVCRGDALSFLRDLPESQKFDVLILDFPDVADNPVLEKLYRSLLNGPSQGLHPLR